MREGKRQPGWMRRRLRVRRPIGGSERVRRWLRFAGPRRGTMPDQIDQVPERTRGSAAQRIAAMSSTVPAVISMAVGQVSSSRYQW